MFDAASRYYAIDEGTIQDDNGKTIPYKRRRFLPQGSGMTLVADLRIAEGERLDNLAARNLGDPLLFWRICDANDAMNPLELTECPGRILRIAVPRY